MKTKPKILFWINLFFYHFSLAYYLQSHLDAEFFAIIDTNYKPKKFFQNQTLVKFQKTWFFHDYIKKTPQEPDLKYLENFEKTYKIDLWKLVLNERFFYMHNRFYKFKRKEILSILEQELKLFESILDEIKPDYFLTYNPVLHHQKLLLEVCRKKGIKVLNSCRTGINDQTVLVEDGQTFDLDLNQTLDYYCKNNIATNDKKNTYDLDQKIWIENRQVGIQSKIIGLKDYLFSSDDELINSNFMYYGKTKFKVIKDALSLEYKKTKNYNFIKKFSIFSPSLSTQFVYFPLNINEEASLLHYASYYTNQVEVIRHIAKSIPIDYVLYVKEHIAAKLRGWNDIKFYKEIIDIPNVKFIHPEFDNDILIKHSQLLISIRGSSTLKAVKYGKPTITFGKQLYQIIPNVFVVDSLDSLPELICKALECKTNPSDYKKFEDYFYIDGFDFPINVYEVIRNKILLSGNGVFSNVSISNQTMIDFLEKNKRLFSNSIQAHLKIISKNN